MEDVLPPNNRIQCDICGGRHTYTNKRNHLSTILHQNALIKAQAAAAGAEVQPVTSIKCNVCGGQYWNTSKHVHDVTNKHIRAMQIKIKNDK